MKTTMIYRILLLALSMSISLVHSRNSIPDPKDPTANQIYGTEPYQLQFQEPSQIPGNNYNYYPQQHSSSNNNYYPYHPHPSSNNPPIHHHPSQIQRKRYQDNPLDYDPFYFSARNGIPSGIVRTRRNSKFREFEPISNHLFNEDVHFFRRGDPTESLSLRIPEHIKENIRLPVYESNPSYFPVTRSSFPRPGGIVDDFHSASSGMTYDTRGRYPPYSNNNIDVYETPRHQHVFPKLFVPDRQRYARDPIDGWSVQVGTQLQVHDDGRERNPGRFYVRDEKPINVRRYPQSIY